MQVPLPTAITTASELAKTEIDSLCAESAKIYRIDPPRSLALATQARERSSAIGYPFGEATSLHRLATLARVEGQIDQGLAYGFEAQKIFETIGEAIGVIRCKNNRAGFLKDLGKLSEAILLYQEVIDDFRVCSDPNGELSATIGLSSCYELAGDTAGFLEASLIALEKCRAAGLMMYEAASLVSVAGSYVDFGDWAKAIRYYEEAIEALERQEDVHLKSGAIANLGFAHWKAGNVERARELYEQSVEYSTQHSHIYMQIVSESSLGYLLIEIEIAQQKSSRNRKDIIARGVALADHAIELAQSRSYAALLAQSTMKRADIHQLLGETKRALELYRAALASANGFDLVRAEILEKLATCHSALGEHSAASDYRGELVSMRERMNAERNQHLLRAVEVKLAAERARSEREALMRERDELRKQSAEREQRLAGLALSLAERHELLEWVRAELIRHQKTELNGELPKAVLRAIERHIKESDGWSAFEFEFSEVAAEFSQNLARRAPDLSPTEIRISALLRIGLSTKQIASLLQSSVRTIDWHRSSIRKKLGVPTADNLTIVLRSI